MISAITPCYMAVKGLATSWFCVCFLITVLGEDMAQQKQIKAIYLKIQLFICKCYYVDSSVENI